MRAGLSGSVDRWTRRPSWRCVYQEHDLEFRNLRRHIRDFPETTKARVTSYDYQILRPSGSGDDKVVLAARVTETRVGSRESLAVHVSVPVAIVRTWWRVRKQLEVGFLGFGHDMPWSTSVLLVSSGEGFTCIDLIWRGTDCLGLSIWTQQ